MNPRETAKSPIFGPLIIGVMLTHVLDMTKHTKSRKGSSLSIQEMQYNIRLQKAIKLIKNDYSVLAESDMDLAYGMDLVSYNARRVGCEPVQQYLISLFLHGSAFTVHDHKASLFAHLTCCETCRKVLQAQAYASREEIAPEISELMNPIIEAYEPDPAT